jgi:hypothetical protein
VGRRAPAAGDGQRGKQVVVGDAQRAAGLRRADRELGDAGEQQVVEQLDAQCGATGPVSTIVPA